MAPKILIFAGAPLSAALAWDEPCLIDSFCEPISQFAGLDRGRDVSFVPATAETTSSLDKPSWRSIPLERRHLATGVSQTHTEGHDYQGAAFFTASDIDSFMEDLSQPHDGESQASNLEKVEQVLSQFYEQSYASHEDISSSQIAATADTGSLLYSNDTSSYESSMESSTFSRADIPNAGQVTNLRDVPNATYLTSIDPQTMTVNLIIGIISIPPPRSIKTRRGGHVELVEILAGDETKSGFAINFWLSSSKSADGAMRSVLSGLRPQDVVLMRNVALSSFRGKVYGQSLRKDMTKLYLLYRNRVDKADVGGCYSAADLVDGTNDLQLQAQKTNSVREWVLRFVGNGPGPKSTVAGRLEAVREKLPPDTQ